MGQDMPGVPPPFILLIAINFPLAIPRTLMFRYFSLHRPLLLPYLWGRWGDIALVTVIGMLLQPRCGESVHVPWWFTSFRSLPTGFKESAVG
jgi:hypothetical protein